LGAEKSTRKRSFQHKHQYPPPLPRLCQSTLHAPSLDRPTPSTAAASSPRSARRIHSTATRKRQANCRDGPTITARWPRAIEMPLVTQATTCASTRRQSSRTIRHRAKSSSSSTAAAGAPREAALSVTPPKTRFLGRLGRRCGVGCVEETRLEAKIPLAAPGNRRRGETMRSAWSSDPPGPKHWRPA